ncbi:hypothetical protein E2542_SST20529 [Spatholobus suberectus]|nr:hypothetical protein E2542_SST20529 [Spatholobus suberectus]
MFVNNKKKQNKANGIKKGTIVACIRATGAGDTPVSQNPQSCMPDFSVAPLFRDHTPFAVVLTIGEARAKHENHLFSYTSVSSPSSTICAAKRKGCPSTRRSLVLALINGSSLCTRRQLRPLTTNEIHIVLPRSCSRAHVSLASLKIRLHLHCRCCSADTRLLSISFAATRADQKRGFGLKKLPKPPFLLSILFLVY